MKITARQLSGQVCDVQLEGPVMRKITARPEDISDLPWIAPGLIDLQINGFGGVDFNRELASEEAWRHSTQQLYAHGCTGFLIALITNREQGYRHLLGGLTERLRRDPRNCLGFHLEGPWLNPDPGYRGAHRPEWMQVPDRRWLEEWRALAGDRLRLMTLAPEIDWEKSLEVIRAGSEKKIKFFVGHSAAMGENLSRAVAAGVVGWTHLGNAAPATAPKFENVIFHALAQTELMASLIPDGVHLPPHAFRALSRSLEQATPSRLLLTTDAMAGAAADGPGRYTLGETEVRVGEDGAARLMDSGRLAGSTLTPFQGVFRARQMSGLPLEQVWQAFSARPATLLGFGHGLTEGHSADFCLMTPEKTPSLLATYHRGRCVYQAP